MSTDHNEPSETPGPKEPANVRVWANLWFGAYDPAALGREAAAHAALDRECTERGVRFERTPFVVDGHIDAHAEGTEDEIVPLLLALGERGHSYAIDVSVDDRLDAGADAEHQVF